MTKYFSYYISYYSYGYDSSISSTTCYNITIGMNTDNTTECITSANTYGTNVTHINTDTDADTDFY